MDARHCHELLHRRNRHRLVRTKRSDASTCRRRAVVKTVTRLPDAKVEQLKKASLPAIATVTVVAHQQTAPAVAVELPAGEAAAKAFIYSHESGNRTNAINPSSGACGLGQALPCQKLTAVCQLSDYACQDAYFTSYMRDRYGTWSAAQAFWLANNWW